MSGRVSGEDGPGRGAGPAPGPAARRFGFSAVVAHDDLKLALLLAAVDPAIGGVLLRGDKGAGKTTLARALAALLPGDAPFVDLPLGATEDRVLGSIDIGAALSRGAETVRSGLLADAHGGVLYVDEVNLLADHLVDALLDVAVSGEHRLERDGVSVVQPARFVLVGTMNPEEGELRPQLLDRFGLCVTVTAPDDPGVRAEIVRRRLALDGGGGGDPAGVRTDLVDGSGDAGDAGLRARLARTRPAALDDDAIAFASRLALAVGAEGLRADIVLCRAAAALAGWEGRPAASVGDVERVARLALPHRRRRAPFDPPSLAPDELAEALAAAHRPPPAPRPADGADPDPQVPAGADPPGGHTSSEAEGRDGRADRPEAGPVDGGREGEADRPEAGPVDGGRDGGGVPAGPDRRPVEVGAERAAPPLPTDAARRAAVDGGPSGRRSPVAGARGRVVRDAPFRPAGGGPIAVAGTVRRVAARRADEPGAAPQPEDLRAGVHEDRTGTLVVIALDTSGSMGARERVRAATGAVLGLLTDAYQRRDRVAVVSFDGEGARVALAPTSSIEVARTRLASLRTGGTTPLAAGVRTALDVALRRSGGSAGGGRAVLVVVTDGRATAGPAAGDAPTGGRARVGGDAVGDALDAARAVRSAGIPALVLDAETGTPRLGLAAELGEAMGASCRPIAELTSDTLRRLGG